MSIVRAVDEDGDWTFGAGAQSYRRDRDAMEQSIRTRLLSWNGDCFFALPEGVDWNNYIGPGRKRSLDQDIKRVLLQTEGVLTIAEGSYRSEIDPATRTITIEATIRTLYGEVRLNEEVVV